MSNGAHCAPLRKIKINLEELKYKYDGEVDEIEKLSELQRYLNKRKDTMKRYKDYEGVKEEMI